MSTEKPSSIALVFSGQGSQYSGMGKELFENFRVCKDVFDEASESLGFNIAHICFDEAYADKLAMTKYCQPAILTLSYASSKLLDANNISVKVLAGLSLGEYSALTYAKVFEFKDAVALVHKRGEFMERAVTKGVGGMTAILGLENSKVEELCKECSKIGYISCANYNAPGQIVVAGVISALEAIEKMAIEAGAKKAIRLNVSGPFHSELLSSAKDLLEKEFEKIKLNDFVNPVISNVNAKVINSKDDVKNILLKQIISPVLWEDSVRTMLDMGVDTFIELGCGKTLLSFIKQVDRKVKLANIEDMKSYEKALKLLEQ